MLDLLKKRRTQYALDKNLPLPQDDVDAMIRDAVRVSPSSFNSQSSRVVILFGAESDKLWSVVLETLRKMVPADKFAATEARINSFAAGAGTVLFFEDMGVVKGLQEQMPAYADNFPIWAEQASGMAQLAVWTVLTDADIGASLQHYNPIIDDEVIATWGLPLTWKLRAQMPFGGHAGEIAEKTFIDDAARFRTFG